MTPRRSIRFTLILLSLLVFVAGILDLDAQMDNVDVHGFILGNFTGRTTGLSPGGGESGDYLLAEERLRLDISTWSGSIDASARFKGDFLHDALIGEFETDLREAYIDYSTGNFDFRLGRQIITWGVGDLLFINDVFPKDWVSFFTGRPLEYLKVGIDGFRTRYSSNSLNLDFVVIPLFEADELPAADRFFLFDPFGAGAIKERMLPEATFENTELALRLYRRVTGFDVSGYAYKGFWRTPAVRSIRVGDLYQLTAFYPELSVFGWSAQGNGLGGLLSFEAGYYDSRDDRDGDDPAVLNSQIRLLVGYQRPFGDDFNFGVQYEADIMEDHPAYVNSLPQGFPGQKRYRDTVTLRLEQLLKYHTWKLTFFAFYSPADKDYLVQPQVSHKLSDELSVTLGANLFGGDVETTFLGQFDKNDNAYLSARFDF